MRLIDADALKIVACGKNHHRRYIWADITDAPTIEAEPVRHGKWTTHRTRIHDGEWYCSVCDYEPTVFEGTKRCPNCGAKMEVEND